MSDDHSAAPRGMESTIIRPRPAGVVGVHADAEQADDPALSPVEHQLRTIPKVGTNALIAAAAPLLAAVVRVASELGEPDVDHLRRALIAAMRRFEVDAIATGMDTRALRAARYALCATIDDIILSTPWGRASSWVQQSMTSIFHNEVTGGERFYEILQQMQEDLGHHEPVVELMYFCMSLGFVGRYRVMPRGSSALAELRDGVYRTIRQRRGDFETELSPHWRGVDAGRQRPVRRVPLWALGVATAGVAATIFVTLTLLLAGVSDVAFAELFALPPRGQIAVPRKAPLVPAIVGPASPAAPTPAGKTYDALRRFLDPEIRAGLVQVMQDAQTVTVRLTNRNMFASGTANLAGSYGPLLGRIGGALNDETGNVVVVGFTDNQPIRTPRFPSNFELSQARADAVAALLHLNDPRRLRAQGKGAADPIASNATGEGRQQNRRTEIVLVRTPDAR
ncbi:MAG TPA: type VI secretion system protein TssL, long form [Acetobacteraceae bacterium]|jgi:type VI secretion system protein ImpK|nr:type VI secretion system protein TssL, long form [Acetobacteraceae bacterium]